MAVAVTAAAVGVVTVVVAEDVLLGAMVERVSAAGMRAAKVTSR